MLLFSRRRRNLLSAVLEEEAAAFGFPLPAFAVAGLLSPAVLSPALLRPLHCFPAAASTMLRRDRRCRCPVRGFGLLAPAACDALSWPSWSSPVPVSSLSLSLSLSLKLNAPPSPSLSEELLPSVLSSTTTRRLVRVEALVRSERRTGGGGSVAGSASASLVLPHSSSSDSLLAPASGPLAVAVSALALAVVSVVASDLSLAVPLALALALTAALAVASAVALAAAAGESSPDSSDDEDRSPCRYATSLDTLTRARRRRSLSSDTVSFDNRTFSSCKCVRVREARREIPHCSLPAAGPHPTPQPVQQLYVPVADG